MIVYRCSECGGRVRIIGAAESDPNTWENRLARHRAGENIDPNRPLEPNEYIRLNTYQCDSCNRKRDIDISETIVAVVVMRSIDMKPERKEKNG